MTHTNHTARAPFRLLACSAIAATLGVAGMAAAQPAGANGTGATGAGTGTGTGQMDRTDRQPMDRGTDRGMGGDRGQMMGGMRGQNRVLSETFGATVRPLPRDQAQANDVKPGVGLVVENVKPGSPAEKGGLKQGDVITRVGDQWAINAAQVATLLSIQDADNGFEIRVRRGTESTDLDYKFDKTALDAMASALSAPPAMGDMNNGPGDREMTHQPGMDNPTTPTPTPTPAPGTIPPAGNTNNDPAR